jgi:hypothetical protein
VVGDQQTFAGEQKTEPELADAPVTPVSSEKPLPAYIRPNGPSAEIIKLANSGVAEGVMLAFVTNSPGSFSLSAEEIIYLNDIGVPSTVVTAMMQHDQVLKVSPPLSASFTATAPPPQAVPSEVAPQWDQPAGPYPAEPVEEAAPPDFYDSLAPYGSWVDVGGYGPCWQPTAAAVNPGWRPYFDCGHWAYTDCGWYWLSDYSWGWAPYHYGRWFRHHRLGWCWAPDSVWGPSWVSWRYTDDYCGWAPLPPFACYTPGIGFTCYGRPVGFGFTFGLGWNSFAFVSWQHFHDHHLQQHGLGPQQAHNVFKQSAVVTRIGSDRNTVINEGIAPERVAAATHKTVHPLSIRAASGAPPSAGRAEQLGPGGRSLTVYRPALAPMVRPATSPAGGPRTQIRDGNNLKPGAKQEFATAAPLILHGRQELSPTPSPEPPGTGASPTPWATTRTGRDAPVATRQNVDPAEASHYTAPPVSVPRYYTPAPSYRAGAGWPSYSQIPRYSSAPSYDSPRPSYTPAPSYGPSPTRQSYAPAPSMPAPAQAPAVGARPAVSAPAPAAPSYSPGTFSQGGRGSR